MTLQKSQPNWITCSLLLAVAMISFFYEIKGLAAKSKGWAVLYFMKFMAFYLFLPNQTSDTLLLSVQRYQMDW